VSSTGTVSAADDGNVQTMSQPTEVSNRMQDSSFTCNLVISPETMSSVLVHVFPSDTRHPFFKKKIGSRTALYCVQPAKDCLVVLEQRPFRWFRCLRTTDNVTMIDLLSGFYSTAEFFIFVIRYTKMQRIASFELKAMSVPDARHIPRQQGLSKLVLFLANYEGLWFS
jgi:hypothetical protein